MKRYLDRRFIFCLAALVIILFSFVGPLAASGGGSGNEAKPKGWVATDSFRVMNFAVLAIGLYLIARKPVANALNKRIEDIRTELDDLERQKAQADKNLTRYENKLAELDQETEKIIETYVKQGNEAKVKILAAAQDAAEKMRQQAQNNISQEFKLAQRDLKAEIVDKSLATAEKLIVSQIGDTDQRKLVDEYLDKVVA